MMLMVVIIMIILIIIIAIIMTMMISMMAMIITTTIMILQWDEFSCYPFFVYSSHGYLYPWKRAVNIIVGISVFSLVLMQLLKPFLNVISFAYFDIFTLSFAFHSLIVQVLRVRGASIENRKFPLSHSKFPMNNKQYETDKQHASYTAVISTKVLS